MNDMDDPQLELDDDGELHESKRKSKEASYPSRSLNRLVWVLGLLFLLLVAGIGGAFMARYLFPQTVMIVTPTPSPTISFTQTPLPAATSTPVIVIVTATPSLTEMPIATATTDIPTLQANTSSLLVSLGNNGDLYTYSAENGLIPLNMQGHDVATATDGKIAYWLPTQPFIYQNGRQFSINSFGQIRRPALSADGNTLAFLALGTDEEGNSGAGVYLLPITTTLSDDSPTYLGLIARIGGPPLFDPLTGALLIVENVNNQRSEFYELDPTCECEGYLVAAVSHNVTWATYDPDGSRIIFSEASGDLYALDPTTVTTTPFLVDDIKKFRPTFSPDGSQLAYFDAENQIYILTLATREIQTIPMDDAIDSIAWYGT